MAKYDPLKNHLADLPSTVHEVSMTFSEVERIVGTLPPSARKHRAWWSNDSKVEAQAWRAAGWHVAAKGVDMGSGSVRFARGRVGGSRIKRLQQETSR